MKRTKALPALFCVLLLLACTAGQPERDAPSGKGEDAAAPAPALREEAPLSMSLALSGPGVFSGEVAGNGEGAYSIFYSTQDNSGRLLYYDYATRQLLWLSDQLIVTNDEENPGYLADTFGGTVPIAANGKLYVAKYGKAPIPRIGYEGSPSLLLRMEPNAANRKTLAVPQGSLMQYNTGMAADGADLYLLLADYDTQAMQVTDVCLCRADFEKNTFEKLASLGAEKNAAIVGVFPEGIVLQRSWLPAAYASLDRQDRLPYLQYDLQLFSLRDRTLTDAGFSWKQGDLSLVFGPGVVYYVESGSTRLCAFDLQSKTRQVLEENLPARETDGEVLLTGTLTDGHLCFLVRKGEQSERFCYSLADRQVRALTLSYLYKDGEQPVMIAAEGDRYFLVNYGFTALQRSATGTDGAPYTFESPMVRYALIGKEDYWNSAANFLLFDDTLFREAALTDG